MQLRTKANALLTTHRLISSTTSKLSLRALSTPARAISHELSPLPLEGTKVLEKFTEEFEVGNKVISFETGKIARFANGAVVMGMEETKVLSTVVSAKGGETRDFLPLTVDYQEKQYAQGVIPNTFMRREGAPKERELLCGRLIDRPIRPLFPAGFYHEVQVMASVLSSDGKQDPDVMAANATSAALMLSDIPWNGPMGVIRVGRICGQFVINPSMDEVETENRFSVFVHSRPGFVFSSSKTMSSYFLFRQVNNSIQVDWGGASMIQAERILLENALMDPDNLCGQEGRYNPKMHPIIPVQHWRKGSQRKSLPEFWREKPLPAEPWKEHNCIPDEHYVQTLLAQGEGEITRRSLTHSSWDLSGSKDRERRGWHPVTYKFADATPELVQSIKDIDNIYYETENRREWCMSNEKPFPCFLFARKFTRPAALRLLNTSALQLSN